jgi:hypothetical protein
MSISNELSNDLATTLFNSLKDRFDSNPRQLAEIVFDFKSALEPLEKGARRRVIRFEKNDPNSGEGPSTN